MHKIIEFFKFNGIRLLMIILIPLLLIVVISSIFIRLFAKNAYKEKFEEVKQVSNRKVESNKKIEEIKVESNKESEVVEQKIQLNVEANEKVVMDIEQYNLEQLSKALNDSARNR